MVEGPCDDDGDGRPKRGGIRCARSNSSELDRNAICARKRHDKGTKEARKGHEKGMVRARFFPPSGCTTPVRSRPCGEGKNVVSRTSSRRRRSEQNEPLSALCSRPDEPAAHNTPAARAVSPTAAGARARAAR